MPVAAGRGAAQGDGGAAAHGQGPGELPKVTAGKEGARRDGSAGHGAAGALPGGRRAPSPPPCPPPGPHSPCCGGGAGCPGGSVRRGSARSCGCCNARRSALLWVGGARCRHAPLFGYTCMRGGSTSFGGRGSLAGSSRLQRYPEAWGPKLLPLLCREGGGGIGPGCQDQPSGVTGSAEPPAPEAEQVEQPLTCSATSSPRDEGRH